MLQGKISGQFLNILQPYIVAGTVDYITAQFSFASSDWDGLRKWAHFACGDEVYDIELTDDCIAADKHLNLAEGRWRLWLHGSEYADGELTQRITTGIRHFDVLPTGSVGTDAPFAATPPSAVEQIEGHIGDLADLQTSAKDTLVAAINEAATTGGSAQPVTPDWSQNDPAGAGYIANRPFYSESGTVQVLFDSSITITSDDPYISEVDFLLEEGKEYTVSVDGVEYRETCQSVAIDGVTACYLGNSAVMGLSDMLNGYPYFIMTGEENGMRAIVVQMLDLAAEVLVTGTFALKITDGNGETVHKIDPKFLPEMAESVAVHYLTGAYGIHAFPAADFEAAMAAYFAGKNLLYMAGLLVCDVALDGDYYNIRLARYPLQVLKYRRSANSGFGDVYATFSVPYEGAGIAASYINALDIDGVPQDLEYRFTAQGYIEVDGENADMTTGIAGGYIYPVATEMPSGAKLLGVGDSADHTLQWYDIPEAPAEAVTEHNASGEAHPDIRELIGGIAVPTALSDLTEDTEHRVVTDAEKAAWSAKSDFSGSYTDLADKPAIPAVPTQVSAFANDAGYLTEHQDISGKLDKSGGTLTGALTANATAAPAARQVRNIHVSTAAPTASDGADGDVWLVYV